MVARLLLLLLAFPFTGRAADSALVFLTDFSVRDGAVSAMKGVAFGVDPRLPQFDLTHEIPPFNVWDGAFRLGQAAPFWPSNSVFVCVVDPGVGTDRLPVVLRTRSGHAFVGPDNGLFSRVADQLGVDALHLIDSSRHRLPGSEGSYTFHGRDLFAHVGARLASGQISITEVGPRLTNQPVRIPVPPPIHSSDRCTGVITVLDVQFGNVWSNIDQETFSALNPRPGDRFRITVRNQGKPVATFSAPYVTTFGEVPEGKPLVYLNSLLQLSVALNQDNLAQRYRIGSGPDWTLEARLLPRRKSP
jgi:S-adenosylmethionine hydrolase